MTTVCTLRLEDRYFNTNAIATENKPEEITDELTPNVKRFLLAVDAGYVAEGNVGKNYPKQFKNDPFWLSVETETERLRVAFGNVFPFLKVVSTDGRARKYQLNKLGAQVCAALGSTFAEARPNLPVIDVPVQALIDSAARLAA